VVFHGKWNFRPHMWKSHGYSQRPNKWRNEKMDYSFAYSGFGKMMAYLDPGSGSILIQMVIASLLGAGLLIRSQWAKIKKFLGMSQPDTGEDELEDDLLDE